MANLKRRVWEKSGELSESEKEIIRFLFSNPTLCSHLSLSKLAQKLYVSESSIFRLCKKIKKDIEFLRKKLLVKNPLFQYFLFFLMSQVNYSSIYHYP